MGRLPKTLESYFTEMTPTHTYTGIYSAQLFVCKTHKHILVLLQQFVAVARIAGERVAMAYG